MNVFVVCGSYPGPDANDGCTSQPKSSGHPISATRIRIPSPTVHPPALPLFGSRLTPVSQLDFPEFSECFRSDELTDTSENYLYKSPNRRPKLYGSEEWPSHLLVEDCELPPNPPSTPPLSSYDQPNRHQVYPHLHAPRRHLLGITRPSHYALSPPPPCDSQFRPGIRSYPRRFRSHSVARKHSSTSGSRRAGALDPIEMVLALAVSIPGDDMRTRTQMNARTR